MKTKSLGYLYLLNTIFFFSTYEVVSKMLVEKIDPFQINFIRFFIGGVILFLVILYKRDIHISKKDLYMVSVIGIINVVISMNLLQVSLYMPNARASVVAVIFSSNPIFVFAFSVLIDREKVHAYKLVGMLMGMAGIVVIFFEKLQVNLSDLKSPLLALASAVFYGLYTVIGRKSSVRIGSLKMNAYSFIIGSLVLLPMLLFFKMPTYQFDVSGIGQVLYLSVLVTGLAYWTYFKGLSIAGASKGSLVFFIKPALASVIAILLLGEIPTVNLLLGTAFIIVGIMITVNWIGFKEKFIVSMKDFVNTYRI